MKKFPFYADGRRADGLFDYDPLKISADPYGVQGIVVREIGMDQFSQIDGAADDDRVYQLWHPEAYRDLCQKYWSSGPLGISRWARSATPKVFLDFARDLCELLEVPGSIVGFRIVRNTNLGNGYPIYSFQWVKEGRP